LFSVAAKGFAIGGSLILAIGAQNAFVLRQGLKRQYVLPIVLICALSDASLIAAGVLGLGELVKAYPVFLKVVLIGGAIFLFTYGGFAFRRALRPSALIAAADETVTLRAAILTVLAFTWLNPHVYLDTVLLVGGFSAQYHGAERLAFGIGAVTSSFAFFFSLGYGARILQPVFAKPMAWRVLDIIIGLVMWALAFDLVRSWQNLTQIS